jgi:hypothetical protein
MTTEETDGPHSLSGDFGVEEKLIPVMTASRVDTQYYRNQHIC